MASAILGFVTHLSAKADPFIGTKAGMTSKRSDPTPIVKIYNFCKDAHRKGSIGVFTGSSKIESFFNSVLVKSNMSKMPKIIWDKSAELRDYVRVHQFINDVNSYDFQQVMTYFHSIITQIDMMIASEVTFAEKADGSGGRDVRPYNRQIDIGDYIALGSACEDLTEAADISEQYRVDTFLDDYGRQLRSDSSFLDAHTPEAESGYDYMVTRGIIAPFRGDVDNFKRHDYKTRAIDDSNEPFYLRNDNQDGQYLGNQYPRPGLQSMERECPPILRPEARLATAYFT